MVSNPRPCECGHQQMWHAHRRGFCYPPGAFAGPQKACLCPRYRPAKRTEPLRAVRRNEAFYRTADAMRTGKTSGHFWHRRLDEMPDPTESAPAVDLATATVLPTLDARLVPVERLRKFLDVDRLREFIDAELDEAEDERSADAAPVEKAFWDGVQCGLGTVRDRFCG